MGNAAIRIFYPSSLDIEPYLESGKISWKTPVIIQIEKKEGAAVGCGGRMVFKKNVLESQYTFKITKQISARFDLEVGREVTVEAKTEKEAEGKVAVKFGISKSEITECVTLIKTVVDDKNKFSELYCYVDYKGKNNGGYHWTMNDLKLNATSRWAEDSELFIDINF